jgi:hypothetical protein
MSGITCGWGGVWRWRYRMCDAEAMNRNIGGWLFQCTGDVAGTHVLVHSIASTTSE